MQEVAVALLGTIKHTLTVVQVVAVMADLLHRQEQQILAVVEAVMVAALLVRLAVPV